MMLKYLAEIKFDLPQRREDVMQSVQVEPSLKML